MSTSTVIYTLVGVDRASGAFRSAGMSADRTASKLGMLGKAAGLAVGAIAAAATAVAVESVKSAVAFQGAMEKIHTQAGASQASVESLTKSVLKLAPATQQGPQELAAALYHLKSLGMDNAAAMKALAQSSNLAAVGGANIEDTATAIGAAWRSGIKGGQSFSKVAATVNAIIGAGNMRMEDFVQSLSSGILPAARTFGVGLSSIGAAMALMTDEGIPAVDAATRLRMTLSLLGAPSVLASKQLATIGLSSTALGQAMRGPQGIIGAVSLLKQHLDDSGLSATQSAALISRAFGGGRSSSAIMTLLNNLGVLERKQKQINETTGNYGPAVAAQRKTAQAQFALLRSSIDTLGIRIGLALLPPVTRFVTFLAKTGVPDVEKFAGKVMNLLPVHAIEREADRIKATILGLLGIHQHAKPRPVRLPVNVAGLRPQQFDSLMTQMGARKPLAIPVTITGLKVQQLNAVLGQSFTALAGQPPPAGIGTWLASALGKVNWGRLLATAINTAVSSAQQIGAAFLALLSKINWVSFGGRLATIAVGLAIGLVNNLIPALISTAVHHPLDMLSFLAALIPAGKLSEGIIKVFGEVKFIGPLLKFFLTPIEKAGGLMEAAVGKLLKKVFGPIGKRLLSFFTGSDHWLAKAGLNIVQGFDLGLTKAWKVMVWPWLKKIPGFILDLFAKADSWLTGKGMRIIGGLLGGAEHALGPALDWLGGVGSRVIGVFARAGSWLKGVGGNIIGGMLGGIRDAMTGIGNWVMKYIVDPVITWVKHFFGIHSPSTVMAGIGSHLIGGLFQGMMSHDLGGMVVKIFGSLPAALAKIVEKGLVSVAELPVRGLQALGHGLDKLFGGGNFPGLPQLVGKAMAASMGWTGGQWTALDNLWTRESGWNPSARNPKSGAYGIPQALPGSKMASAGPDWLTNPGTQIKWGLGYILGRYGSPAAAWAHEKCVPLDVEILTRRGWLTYDQIREDDETIGYNPETGRSEWTPIVQVHVYEDAPLVRLSNKTWEAVCTPNHRWVARKHRDVGGKPVAGRKTHTYRLVDEFIEAEKITSRHALRLAAMADLGDGPAIDEREAELLGWVLGDGSVARLKSKKGSNPDHWRTGSGSLVSVRLYQSKPGHVETIDALVTGMMFNRMVRQINKPGGEPGLPLVTWEFTRSYSAELLKRSGYDHHNPVPFVMSLNETQRTAFLRGVFGAEGSFTGNGSIKGRGGYQRSKVYHQADGAKQDAIVLAIYLNGMRPGISPWGAERDANSLGCANPRPGASIRETKPFIGGERVRRENAGRGAVWCVSTGLGSWTMRQGRQVMLTGNSVGWYGHGGPFKAGQVIGVGDRGPELVQFSQAGRVLSPEDSAALIQSESARKIRSAYAAISANITDAFAAGVNKTRQQAIDASRKLTAQVGAAFAAGKLTTAQDSSLLARIKTDLDTAERRIAAAHARAMKTLHNLSLALSQGILASLQGTASQVKSAAGKLVTAVKTVMDAGLISFPRATALTKFIDRDNTRLQALAKQRAKIAATIAAAQTYASTVASNVASGAQLVNLPTVTNGGYISGGGLISDLHEQLSMIRRFGSDLRTLRNMGLSRALLSQVIAAGPQQGDQLARAFISSGAAGIVQANRTEAAIGKASRAVGRSAANYMYDSGKQAGRGFLSGLKAQEAAISKVMAQIARTLVKTIKRELGIHSPSKVTFGIGEFTGIGIEEGMLSRVRHIEAAGSRLAVAAVPGQRRGAAAGHPGAVAASAQGGEFTGNLYLDSGEFLGVVRGEIREHDRKLVGAATRGAGLAG